MFKKGELIKCVVTTPDKRVFAGGAYTVREIFGEWMNLTHTDFPYHIGDFKRVNNMTIELNSKAKSKTKAPTKALIEAYYVRHKSSGHGVNLAASQTSSVQVPATLIASYDDAVNEANRLAELHPQSEFVILGVVYRVKKVPVYATESHEYGV